MTIAISGPLTGIATRPHIFLGKRLFNVGNVMCCQATLLGMSLIAAFARTRHASLRLALRQLPPPWSLGPLILRLILRYPQLLPLSCLRAVRESMRPIRKRQSLWIMGIWILKPIMLTISL